MYGIGLSNFDKPIFLKVRNNYISFIQQAKGLVFSSDSVIIYNMVPKLVR